MSKRKTHEKFVEEVKLLDDDYEVIGRYIKSNIKITLKHKRCNNEYDIIPNDFLQGSRCQFCAIEDGGQRRTLKSHEEFCKEVYDLVGNEYEVLEKYKGNKEKIRILHKKCNTERYISPNSFLRNTGCPTCSGNKKKTQEQFIKEVYDLVEDEYTVIGDYINNRKKIKIQHNNDKCNNYQYEVSPIMFIRGNRCPVCSGKKQYTTDEFKKLVYNLVGNEYEVIGEYVNSYTKVTFKHNSSCENTFDMLPGCFTSQNQRCPVCSIQIRAKKKTKTHDEFAKQVFDLVGDEYGILGEYTGNHTKIKLFHNTCKNIWNVEPNSFINSGYRCPVCNESKGERKIRSFLEKNNVSFKREFIFDDLLSDKGNPLRFDFAILTEGNNLNMIIEMDGKQHHEPIEHFGGIEQFKIQQYHDQLKNDYCTQNNIPLLRIPYWDFDNIESILTTQLEHYNLLEVS